MLFNFIFVDSSGNAAANWAIVALVGAKGLVAAINVVGGAEGTEVGTGGGIGGYREEAKGEFLFSYSQMTDVTWERPDL